MIFVICTSPIFPFLTASLTALKLWSKRLLKPTWYLTLLSFKASITSFISLISCETGFSQKTCLPAFIASSEIGACVFVDEHIKTASTLSSFKISL